MKKRASPSTKAVSRRVPKSAMQQNGNGTEEKALLFVPQTAAVGFPLDFPGTDVKYDVEVKNGMKSSVVTSALCWMMRTFPEAPVVVQREQDNGHWKTVSHDLSKLLRRPNPEYGGRLLWMCVVLDLCFGEAYLLKVRSGAGKLLQLWWIPRQFITPQPDPQTGRLDYYRYEPGYAAGEDLDPNDVVHFRFGKDPKNLLRGFSPLSAVMREVYVDDQAANFTAAILKNLGIIGVAVWPKAGNIKPEEAAKLKDDLQQRFSKDNRGKGMVFTAPMEMELMQYNLQGFDVGPIRDVSEERVCASLGIPAAVIGFGTGLQQTKVGATMKEMVKLAWQGGIEPLQSIVADEMDRSLLPEFNTLDLFRTYFDRSQVEALTESPMEMAQRMEVLTRANIVRLNEARVELGFPSDTAADKYLYEVMPKPAAPPAKAPANADTQPGTSNE